MTGRADFGLRLLDELMFERFRAVNAVARRTRQVTAVVGTAFPCGVRASVVTGQTDRIDLTGLHLLDLHDVPARLVVRVGLPRAVTGFASVRGHRRPGVL